MSLIRPELASLLRQWAEPLIATLILLWGLYWVFTGLGLFPWIGGVLVAVGASWGWSGFQRARFQTGTGGLGMVEIDERQITYLAPVGGGMVSIDALNHVAILRDKAGQARWRFTTPEMRLSVPAAAAGAESLFDVITALPGAQMETAIRTLKSPPENPVTIWSRGPRAIDTSRAIPHS